MYILVTS